MTSAAKKFVENLAELGIRAESSELGMLGSRAKLRGTASWVLALNDDPEVIHIHTIGDLIPFEVEGAAASTSRFALEMGVDFQFSEDAQMSLSYINGELMGASGNDQQTVEAKFVFRF